MIHEINIGTLDWELVFRDRKDEARKAPWSVKSLSHCRLSGSLAALLDIETPRILVIGSRDPSSKDISDTTELIREISRQWAGDETKPVIISGLAMGTDTAVHRTALNCGLPTVAVVATGLDTVYPSQNKELACEILRAPGSGILTQFPDGTAPEVLNFFDRNISMIMMSDMVIVTCSKAQGGALTTARYAASLGIPVYCLPGSNSDLRHVGTNQLIIEGTAKMLPSLSEVSVRTLF